MTPAAANDARTVLASALAGLRNSDGGWPYYRGRRSRLEPTCWAMLATGAPFETTPLYKWASGDGLLVEPGTPHANYAFNGLAALAIGASPSAERIRANLIRRLESIGGETIEASSASGLDPTLRGWSWMTGTFSWVEPTAWCILALKQLGTSSTASERISIGERLLRDRVCADGGWNYGNAEVFGQLLPAHVPPTASAVLALQDRAHDPIVTRGAAFLMRHGPMEGSTTALAMSAVALAATNHPIAELQVQLAGHVPNAIAFGNATSMAMAAVALADSPARNPLRLQPGVRRP